MILRAAGREMHEQPVAVAVVPPRARLLLQFLAVGRLAQDGPVHEHLPERIDKLGIGLGISRPLLLEMPLVFGLPLAAVGRA
jgi:hypothetical protein